MFDIKSVAIASALPSRITQMSTHSITGTSLVEYSTIDYLEVLTIQPAGVESALKIDRPEGCSSDSIPTVTWLSPEDKDFTYCVVFWGTTATLLRIQGQNSAVCGVKELGKKVEWSCAVRNRVIAIVYDTFDVDLETVPSLFANTAKTSESFSSGFKLFKQDFTTPRMVSFSGAAPNIPIWTENIKIYQNNIYYCRQDGLNAVHILPLHELATSYAEQGEAICSFKLCYEVCADIIKANKEEVNRVIGTLNTLTLAYIDKHLQQINKTPEMISSVLRTVIETMILTKNHKFLFDVVRLKFEDAVFWREIDPFVEYGMLERIPLVMLHLGAIYLHPDSLEYLVFGIKADEFVAMSEQTAQVYSMCKLKKLWPSLFRISLAVPDVYLEQTLTDLLAEVSTSQEKVKTIIEKSKTHSNRNSQQIHTEETALSTDVQDLQTEDDKNVAHFFRLFWFLKCIVNSQVTLFSDKNNELELIWIRTVEWMLKESNLLAFSTIQFNMYLELFFDLFMNVDFASSQLALTEIKRRVDLMIDAKLLADPQLQPRKSSSELNQSQLSDKLSPQKPVSTVSPLQKDEPTTTPQLSQSSTPVDKSSPFLKFTLSATSSTPPPPSSQPPLAPLQSFQSILALMT